MTYGDFLILCLTQYLNDHERNQLVDELLRKTEERIKRDVVSTDSIDKTIELKEHYKIANYFPTWELYNKELYKRKISTPPKCNS